MLDARANPVSTASAEALAAHERVLWHLVAFYGDPITAHDAAIAADPGWGLARVAKAAFLLTLTEPSLVADARTLLAEAEPLMAGAPARERAHLEATRHCACGEFGAACVVWGEVLLEHPRDLLALTCAHLFDFYRGDARNLRLRPARVLPEWEADDPLRPFVLGMLAFGLEECNLYPQAEAVGREALAADPRGPWAIHAVAHVMEMQGRHDDGLRWLAAREADWAPNGLAVHLWWHRALFHLERLDTAGALALYDTHLGGEQTVINLNWLDCASLLWRIELLGADVGVRWGALAARWVDPVAHAGWYAFNDAHALAALLRVGDRGRGTDLVAAAVARAHGGDNRAMAEAVGLPLMRGLAAYADGDDSAAIAALPTATTARRSPRSGRCATSRTASAAATRSAT